VKEESSPTSAEGKCRKGKKELLEREDQGVFSILNQKINNVFIPRKKVMKEGGEKFRQGKRGSPDRVGARDHFGGKISRLTSLGGGGD